MRFGHFFLVLSLVLFFAACGSEPRTGQEEAPIKGEERPEVSPGRQLAETYCTGCHLLPEPSQLDRHTWQAYVLPRMGYRLGIYPNDSTRAGLLETGAGGNIVEQAGIYPERPLLDEEEWKTLVDYYLDEAPTALTDTGMAIEKRLRHFRVRFPSFRLSPPSTTLVHFAPGGRLFIGDANTQALYQFDKQLNLKGAAKLRESPVWLQEQNNNLFLTIMGSFSPTDAPTGALMALPSAGQGAPLTLLPNLQRPVHHEIGDLNGDGLVDVLSCEFAKWTGSLSWWEARPDGGFIKHVLRNQPGATRAYIRDLNGDRLPDIIALMAQGDEGIFAFFNTGKGQFRQERLLQFPSSYGSCFFDLYDFNGDNHLDILYSAGDNADYPPVLKPYHGLRIFLNDGNNRFAERHFIPLHGAYGAMARDFDLDGDLDLAAVSFFPDFEKRPEEGFVYLENQGNFQMKAYSFPEVGKGRWIVVDAGDFDGDGDEDLVLGSLTFEVLPDRGETARWVKEGIPFVVLENTIR